MRLHEPLVGDGVITPGHHVMPQDCQDYPRVDRIGPYIDVPASEHALDKELPAPKSTTANMICLPSMGFAPVPLSRRR